MSVYLWNTTSVHELCAFHAAWLSLPLSATISLAKSVALDATGMMTFRLEPLQSGKSGISIPRLRIFVQDFAHQSRELTVT